jgi:hypothetical protein
VSCDLAVERREEVDIANNLSEGRGRRLNLCAISVMAKLETTTFRRLNKK